MFQKLTTVLKSRVHPYGLLLAGLAVLLLLTTLSGMLYHQHELARQTAGIDSEIKEVSPPQFSKETSNQLPQVAGQKTDKTVDASINYSDKRAMATDPTQKPSSPTNHSTTATGTSVIQVFLYVNYSFKGNVSITGSSNQCNVLSQALQQGILTSLDMRYNSQYKTYAIYAINGIGDSGAVWWAYTVNGKSPPRGCSQVTVHDGDSVNWQYIKQ